MEFRKGTANSETDNRTVKLHLLLSVARGALKEGTWMWLYVEVWIIDLWQQNTWKMQTGHFGHLIEKKTKQIFFFEEFEFIV